MNATDFKYHMQNLRELDADQLVSDLNLSTEDLLSAFHEEVREFIEKEFG